MEEAAIVASWAALALALVVLPLLLLGRALVRRRRARHLVPVGRPLEDILRDARRLNGSFRHPGRGRSFAKYDGTRRAYDGVLVEACVALGVPQRLSELPDSLEHDFERTRIERVLQRAGVAIGISDAA